MTSRRTCCLMLAAGVAGSAALTQAATGQTAPANPRMVVELFTSQGCSSCPPADALLAELAKQPDVIALSLPVDYWDYLGWKDTLASHAHTVRQKGYSISRGDRQIYTPQAVINGVAHAIGSKRGQIERMAAASQGQTLMVPVTLARRDGRWSIELPAGTQAGPAQVVVMTVTKASEVAIGRGENANRKMTYVNVVRSITPVGEWTGAAKTIAIAPAALAVEETDGFVVLVQATQYGKPAAILGAAKSAGL